MHMLILKVENILQLNEFLVHPAYEKINKFMFIYDFKICDYRQTIIIMFFSVKRP